MDKSELEQLINEIYNAYQVDLTSKQDLKNEIQKWVHKCSCYSFNQPANIFDCLKTVKKYFYQNLLNLFKNYIVLPVTTCQYE